LETLENVLPAQLTDFLDEFVLDRFFGNLDWHLLPLFLCVQENSGSATP
jgi:hypothetical protein